MRPKAKDSAAISISVEDKIGRNNVMSARFFQIVGYITGFGPLGQTIYFRAQSCTKDTLDIRLLDILRIWRSENGHFGI